MKDEDEAATAKGRSTTPRVVLILLAVLGIGASVVTHVAKQGSGGSQVSVTAKTNDAACNVKKADGRPGDRECDLVELCKDAAFYNRKVQEFAAEGDRTKAAEAQADLLKTLGWMGEYRHEDIANVCGGRAPSSVQTPVPVGSTTGDMGLTVGTCNAPPGDILTTSHATPMDDFSKLLKERCTGAELRADGSVSLGYRGRTYLVETKTSGAGGDVRVEVTGLWLQ